MEFGSSSNFGRLDNLEILLYSKDCARNANSKIKYIYKSYLSGRFLSVHFYRMLQPLCIGGLLAYFNANNSNSVGVGYAYVCAFGLMTSMLISVIMYHVTQLEILHCGMKMRISCCSLIYRKVNVVLNVTYTSFHGRLVRPIVPETNILRFA